MRDYSDAKAMAKSLRAGLKQQGVEVSHARSLELVARQFDLPDWNVLAAQISDRPEQAQLETKIVIGSAIPIIRSFDGEKARAFYIDYLGFMVDWEHRHSPDMPLYQQISRSGCLLHVSEHHGDATPGGRCFIPVQQLEQLHGEVQARDYPNLNPGLEEVPWGLQMTLTDPFGNRLTFCEQRAAATKP
ncbi:glyoxalase superfamily protein [Pseudophaeobacter sp.]|uniref:glyoxalase superfamily protein n=1 Tax=Pseudophaeobacter sp. TaxID=1971739 RepID=UPI003298C17E